MTGNVQVIAFRGEKHTLAGWAERLGISPQAMKRRLERWPLERALTEPRGKFGPASWRQPLEQGGKRGG